MGWLFTPLFENEYAPIRNLECIGGPLDGSRVDVGPENIYHWDVTVGDGSRVRHTYLCQRTFHGWSVLDHIGCEGLPPPEEA